MDRLLEWLRRPLLWRLALLSGLAWLVLSRAWVADDAYFSFRTVDNFINGYGLTWNVTERVQGFTHPLWVLLLSVLYLFTREAYLTSILFSLALTLGLGWLVLTAFSRSAWHGAAALVLLGLSTAFIDYSTSGLENPLSHLLMIVFLALFFRRSGSRSSLVSLALVAGLAALNRLDTILLFAPALFYEWLQRKDKLVALGEISLGFIPMVIWELFSVIYYGFPFPNTFYAKAMNYVESGEELWIGLHYFRYTLKFDPITWVVILAAFVTATWHRRAKALLIVAGMALYMMYILQIGGDFMGGRFLSTLYVASAVLLATFLFPVVKARYIAVGILGAVLISTFGSSPPYVPYAKDFEISRLNEYKGPIDERMFYRANNFLRLEELYEFNTNPQYTLVNKAAFLIRSVWRGTGFRFESEHDWVRRGLGFKEEATAQDGILSVEDSSGLTGYYAGPDVYIVHSFALTDGLLGRVPPIYDPNWRSGHFRRLVPPGYLEVEAGLQDHLDDAELDAYYQKIRLVTHGPLFTRDRWQAIWELNTRSFSDQLPHLVANFRFPEMQYADLGDISPGARYALNMDFGGIGSAAQVNFAGRPHFANLVLETSGGDNFDLYYLDVNGVELGKMQVRSQQNSVTETHHIATPHGIVEHGFVSIRLVPIRILDTQADGAYSLYSLSTTDQQLKP